MKSSAAKMINVKDMTTPSDDEGGGAREAPAKSGPSGMSMERSGPAPSGGGSGWTGGYSDDGWLGDPSVMKNRQSPSEGSPFYHDDVNIAYPANDPEADIYMVPNFMEQSGQGANQSTLRPIGSV